MADEKAVAIIIPTYNGREHLQPCLESLAALDYPAERVEIIVSDNGSTDGTAAWLAEEWPHVRLVQNGAQVGFGRACNRGAAATQAAFVAFLNNDTRVDPGWLRALFAAREAGDDAACVAAHIKTWDGAEEDFSGAAANLFGSGKQAFVRGWPDRPGPPQAGEPILFACGAAMLIERVAFLDAGGFDPHFFMYFEDVDLGWRLWVLGRRVVYAPDALVYHRGGGTSGAERAPSHRRYVQFEANTLATIVKNYEQASLDRVLPAALALELKRAFLAAGEHIDPADYRLGVATHHPAIDAGRADVPTISLAHVFGTGQWVGMLPALLRERARIQGRRRRPDSEILPLFGRPFAPQFAGAPYAEIQRRVVAALDLYPIVAHSAPNRVLVLAGPDPASQERARALADALGDEYHVAITPDPHSALSTQHSALNRARTADLIVAVGAGLGTPGVLRPETPVVFDLTPPADPTLLPQLQTIAAQRADVLLADSMDQATQWLGGAPSVPVITTVDELRAFARYPRRNLP